MGVRVDVIHVHSHFLKDASSAWKGQTLGHKRSLVVANYVGVPPHVINPKCIVRTYYPSSAYRVGVSDLRITRTLEPARVSASVSGIIIVLGFFFNSSPIK